MKRYNQDNKLVLSVNASNISQSIVQIPQGKFYIVADDLGYCPSRNKAIIVKVSYRT